MRASGRGRSGGKALSRPRILFYIQHLLGIGHLVRGARVARGLADGGFAVTVAIGGELPAGLDFGNATLLRLPPVKAGSGGFADLVNPNGTAFGPEQREDRRDRLLGHFATLEPDILLIEAFPFGRRQMRFELLPLLAAAAARPKPPLMAVSLRDILQESRKAGRDVETVDLVRRCFDLVIVHGDPQLATLDDSFPLAGEIADKLAYSGLVGPDADAGAPLERFDVIVSAGGGAVGAALLRAALEAKQLSRMANASWLVLTGPNLPEADRPGPVPGVTLRAFEPDLPARLRGAQVSVSQAGYNTVVDLLGAPSCRAVLVPYSEGGETEQLRRAGLMSARGWAVTVAEPVADGPALARAIDLSLDLPARTTTLQLDGAARTAQILMRRLNNAAECPAPKTS